MDFTGELLDEWNTGWAVRFKDRGPSIRVAGRQLHVHFSGVNTRPIFLTSLATTWKRGCRALGIVPYWGSSWRGTQSFRGPQQAAEMGCHEHPGAQPEQRMCPTTAESSPAVNEALGLDRSWWRARHVSCELDG